MPLRRDSSGTPHYNCPSCGEIIEDPRYLPCYHTVCAKHLELTNERVTCPVCHFSSGILGEIPKDELLAELLISEEEEFERCANCENVEATLYCKNCNAPMCQSCYDDTHAARVLSKHVHVPLVEHQSSAAVIPCCSKHNKSYDLFCLRHGEFLCITGFLDGAHRGHQSDCVDLESALASFRETVRTTSEKLGLEQYHIQTTISKLQKMEAQITKNAEAVISGTHQLYEKMLKVLGAKKEQILKMVDEEKKKKVNAVASQLRALENTGAIINTAKNISRGYENMMDGFRALKAHKQLMDRSNEVFSMNHGTEVKEDEEISCHPKEQFAQSLENLLFDKRDRSRGTPSRTLSADGAAMRKKKWKQKSVSFREESFNEPASSFKHYQLQTDEFAARTDRRLKHVTESLCDIHRDVAYRRTLSDGVKVAELEETLLEIKADIDCKHGEMKATEREWEQHWKQRELAIRKERDQAAEQIQRLSLLRLAANKLDAGLSHIASFHDVMTSRPNPDTLMLNDAPSQSSDNQRHTKSTPILLVTRARSAVAQPIHRVIETNNIRRTNDPEYGRSHSDSFRGILNGDRTSFDSAYEGMSGGMLGVNHHATQQLQHLGASMDEDDPSTFHWTEIGSSSA